MSDQFLAEIRIFPFNFAPKGWAPCRGQIMPISQNTALFSLLGTNYGGDGRSTFALPNLQGSIPLHAGQGAGLTPRSLGEEGGQAQVTLISTEMPLHSHTARALNDAGDRTSPVGASWATPRVGRTSENSYGAPGTQVVAMDAALAVAGGSAPHNNLPPYLTMNYCIALQGIFPQRH